MKKILVVDDEKINLILAKRLLADEYDVATVESGEKALEYMADNKVDLVLLDVKMNGMDGFEVMEKMKQDERFCGLPVIFLTADRREETESKCFEMGAMDFVSKPFVPVIMKHRIKRTMELEDYRYNLEMRLVDQLQKMTEIQDNIVVTLANMIESRDGTTGEHVKRTSLYTKFLIDKLIERDIYTEELTAEYIDNIIKAAPMHDIGKITIEDSILRKPDKLNDVEYAIMKTHAAAGGELIKANLNAVASAEFVQVAYEMARYHHEYWNGKGYPEGISGTQIPLSARILAVADVYDALSARRVYKEPMSTDKAISIMNEFSGQYDPILLEVFTECQDELKALTDSLFTRNED